MNALGPGLGFYQLSPYQSRPAAEAMMPSAAPLGAAETDTAVDPGGHFTANASAVARVDAEQFRSQQTSQLSAEHNTSLVLALTTREGDRITLDFSQLDTFERVEMTGKSFDGDQQRSHRIEEDSQRLVNMAVAGDLNAAERESVDAVLTAVIEVANRFFSDDMTAAIEKLKMMDFDTSTLAEFSLQMTMSKRVDLSTVTGPSSYDGLKRLAARDDAVSRMLEFFADQQRQLIESASEALDRPSAVKLVKSLLPPMLEASLMQLADKAAGQGEEKVADAGQTDTGASVDDAQPGVLLNV